MESNYKELTMDEFANHPLFMKPDHIPTQEEIDNNEFLASIQAMKYSETGTVYFNSPLALYFTVYEYCRYT